MIIGRKFIYNIGDTVKANGYGKKMPVVFITDRGHDLMHDLYRVVFKNNRKEWYHNVHIFGCRKVLIEKKLECLQINRKHYGY